MQSVIAGAAAVSTILLGLLLAVAVLGSEMVFGTFSDALRLPFGG